MNGICMIKGHARAVYTEKKSEFIAQCFPAETEQQALDLLECVRREFRDARHHCYAYTIGENGSIARYSDAGEPQGTAGLPILTAIRNRNIANVLVVVTRYFGGILLGAGNLTRAYAKAAGGALDAAEKILRRPAVRLSMRVPYSLYGRISSLCEQQKISSASPVFAEDVALEWIVVQPQAEELCATIVDLTDGIVIPRQSEPFYHDFEIQTLEEVE